MSAPAIRHPGEVRWETRLLGVIAAVLVVFGVAAVANATLTLRGTGTVGSMKVVKQIGGVIIGVGVAYFVSLLDYRRLRALAWPILLAVIALLIVTKFGPESIAPRLNGAKRWIRVGGGWSFQPSELARIAVAIWTAMLATKKGALLRDFKRGTLPFLLVLGLLFLLIERQPNLSMAILVAMTGGMVLFVAGARIGHVVISGFIAGILAISLAWTTGYRQDRIRSYACRIPVVASAFTCIGRAADDQAESYQQTQSMNGIASGGLTGKGYGEGILKLGHLPEAGTDFLFATIGEEWGFAGVSFVVLLYATFVWMGFRIARTASDPFGTYLAAGLTFGIGFSAFAHMAVDLGLFPVTGLTLPFMSQGLTSLLTNCIIVGILLSIGQARGRLAPAASRKA